MKCRIFPGLIALAGLMAIAGQAAVTAQDSLLAEPGVVKKSIRRAAEFQLKDYGAEPPAGNWKSGTFFSAFTAAYKATGDEWYLDEAMRWAERSEWSIHRVTNADDVCPAQTYLDLYFIKKDPKMIRQVTQMCETFLDMETIERRGGTLPFIGRNVWWWCDSLYMQPPVMTRLAAATGDDRFNQKMHELYWDTVEFLYDTEEHLFFRDENSMFDKRQTPAGKKMIWARGNGWVIAGLVRVLDYLPESDPYYNKYLNLYREMAYSIGRYQQDDGLWRSCINEPEWFPMPECSGSAFYTFAMAAGINRGWLPEETFLPIVLKGWSGLTSLQEPSGKLGYAQMVDHEPRRSRAADSVDYAHGAFMLAGCEMIRLNAPVRIQELEKRPFKPVEIAADGAWTWFNDNRALVDEGYLYSGYVKKNGKVGLTVYNIEGATHASHMIRDFELSSWSEKDDHNNPALLKIGKNNILAAYTAHNRKPDLFFRNITGIKWGLNAKPERRVKACNEHLATYSNLMKLEDESGRIFNFFRGDGWNPNLMVSTDNGETWSDPITVILSGDASRRPYVKYASNGKDRIDLIYTDGHPRGEPTNSIYHIYYKNGAFHTSEGKVIRSLDQLAGQPLVPEDGTMLYDGRSPEGRGWVWDLEYDASGAPVAAFISAADGKNGQDLRYWIARLGKTGWKAEQIGFAGTCLYKGEQHYAGGITVNPANPDELVFSTDVNPATGAPLPEGKYQLFRAVRKSVGWSFIQLTHSLRENHYRPDYVHGRENTLIWFQGDYRTYKEYDCRVMADF